jgi:hypothetical protein
MGSESSKGKLLYLSHVHARWIKQRPHFLAESFDQLGYDVVFAYSVLTRNEKLVTGQVLESKTRRLFLMPQKLRNRFSILSLILDGIAYLAIRVKIKPDVVVLSHPRFIFIARLLARARIKVIYDCMDFNSAFDDSLVQDTNAESELIEIASLTVCSSLKIFEAIKHSNPYANLLVVRNALAYERFKSLPDQSANSDRIGYFGTIASWFDWDAVLAILEHFPKIEIHLWGPSDTPPIQHTRVIYHSQIEHSLVIQEMLTCRILIMPFKVTPLIEGVDPVKLYEYVATGRSVISVRYPEIRHFGTFVNTYSKLPELIEVVSTSLVSSALDEKYRIQFVEKENWISRAQQIHGAISK